MSELRPGVVRSVWSCRSALAVSWRFVAFNNVSMHTSPFVHSVPSRMREEERRGEEREGKEGPVLPSESAKRLDPTVNMYIHICISL